jgi:hypothetical protein
MGVQMDLSLLDREFEDAATYHLLLRKLCESNWSSLKRL